MFAFICEPNWTLFLSVVVRNAINLWQQQQKNFIAKCDCIWQKLLLAAVSKETKYLESSADQTIEIATLQSD